MNVILAQEDSLRLLRAARADPGLRLLPCDEQALRADEGGRCSVDLDLLNAALPESVPAPDRDRPLRLLSFSREARCKSNLVRPVTLTAPPPPGSFLEVARADGSPLAEGVYDRARIFVEGPGLCVVHMASSISGRVHDGSLTRNAAVVRLAALGMELCGSYSRDPGSPGRGDTAFGLDPLCSWSELESYVQDAARMHGRPLARRAVGHVRDGSASPHETLLSLAFRLPAALGGAGLAEPLANERLVWPNAARGYLKHRTMRPDFHWPQYLLASEYLGSVHGDGDAFVEDSDRIQDYQSCGYAVFPATYDDIRETHRLGGYLARLVRVMARYEGGRFAREKNEMLLDPEVTQARAALIANLLPPRS